MISIRKSHIRLTGYALLLINILIFLGAWCRWYIAIPAVGLLLYGFWRVVKDLQVDESTIVVSKRTLVLIVGMMAAWVVLSGLGGAFPQKHDLHWRNAILHDLIDYHWPVLYSDGSALTYYIAFWLGPALVGKLGLFLFGADVGWTAANAAYSLYCICLLTIVLLLIVSYLDLNSASKILLTAMALILFSGMDIIPVVVKQLSQAVISIGGHLEWWTNIQYSANSTQLAWVYNQAVPAWLATALFLHEKRMDHYAFLGLSLLPYGPFPFIGLGFIMIFRAFQELEESIREKKFHDFLRQLLTVPNVVAALVIMPVYYLYFVTNSASSGNGLNIQMSNAYIWFVLVEFLVYVGLVASSFYKERIFRLMVIGLLMIPMFAIGAEQDFCMRASIPLLFLLMVYVLRYLFANIKRCRNNKVLASFGAILLICCLGVGSVTPLTEYRASYVELVRTGGRVTMADDIGTIGRTDMPRDNFISYNASDSLFYRFIAPDSRI